MQYLLTILFLLLPMSVFAHTASYTVFDFEPQEDGAMDLVVGLQPEMALMLLGHQHDEDFTIETFEAKSDLIAAFVEDHITILQGDVPCTWNAQAEKWPQNEILLRAEGITVRGFVDCSSAITSLTVQTDLFFEAHAEHKNVLRLYQNGIVRDLATLHRNYSSAEIFFEKSSSTTIAEPPQETTEPTNSRGFFILLIITLFLVSFRIYQKKSCSIKKCARSEEDAL